MRLSRLVPALVAGALLVASTSPVQAQTPEVEGVGTTTGSLTLLGLDAGSLLSLDLLSDAGLANIDEASGARSAAAQIAALAVESPAAGVSQTVPLLAVESTGEPQEQSQAITPIDNPVVSGSLLPLSLRALVDDTGAVSTLSAGLADLEVLSGILSLAGTDLDLGSNALLADATGARGVSLDALTVLDLEALLAGLGIPLSDLSLDSLLGLVDGLGLLPELGGTLDQLGLDVANLSVGGITGAVDGLLDEVGLLGGEVGLLEGLQADLTGAVPVCEITDPAVDLLGGLTGTDIGTLCSDVTGSVQRVTTQLTALVAQLDDLTGLLDDVLGAPLDLLGDQSLLRLDGLDVSVVTKATDDVATSVADVTGTLGGLRVGDLDLGALDLASTTEQVDAVLGQVEGAIGGVLGQIAPALSDLVRIDSLAETTSVTQDGDSVVANAAFTGLVVEVLPDIAELQTLLAGLGGVDSVGAQLTSLGLPVPASGATDVLQLNSLLAGVTGVTGGLPIDGGLAALADGLTVEVASLSQQSAFSPVAGPTAPGAPQAPTPTQAPTLPRTGSDDQLVLLLGAGAVAAALGSRYLVRRIRS